MKTTSQIHFTPSLQWRVRGGSWLFLELIVITVVAWVVIDPAVVNLYYRNIPVGYDTDRLVYAEGKALYNGTVDRDAWEATKDYLPNLMNRLKAVDGVENTTYYQNPFHQNIPPVKFCATNRIPSICPK